MNVPDATAYLALDPEAFRDPRPLFDALRAQPTIYLDPATGFYLVADPDTVRSVLQDSDTFSSADAFSPALTESVHFLMSVLTDEQREHFVSPVESIMTSDGETHKRLREAVNAYFTKAANRRRHSAIRARAAEVLDDLGAEADWVQDFCVPFTVHVIADILGVPDTDFNTIVRWDRLLSALATGAEVTAETINTYLEFTKEFDEYFHERAAVLARNPNDSLLSHLVSQGEGLTDHERIQFLLILFPAGSASTVILLTHIAVRLARQPGLMRELRTAPETIPSFVEDSVVERSPSANIFRTATREVTLQGTTIPAGSVLLLLLAAANRGLPSQARHLAFGYGIHRCLGAELARTEGLAALEEILARYQSLTLAQPVESLFIQPHLLIPSHPHLPVSLERIDQRTSP
jgi:cytochrome P450